MKLWPAGSLELLSTSSSSVCACVFSGWRLACQRTPGPSCSCCRIIHHLFHLPTARWGSARPPHSSGTPFLAPLMGCHQPHPAKCRNRSRAQLFYWLSHVSILFLVIFHHISSDRQHKSFTYCTTPQVMLLNIFFLHCITQKIWVNELVIICHILGLIQMLLYKWRMCELSVIEGSLTAFVLSNRQNCVCVVFPPKR